MANEALIIKDYFQSRQVPLSDVWLESCINWCKEENLAPNYTIKDLQINVYEQWLLLDLRDVEIPSLPPNLKTHKKYVLNGNYSLQVMQVVDISKPKHWQLQKIRSDAAFTKNNWQDSEAAGTGKRVLQLTLTDGVQEIDVMEYKSLPTLNVNLTPGIKVLLKGPVTIRRGKVMLEPHNLDLLGGEVEDIAVTHAAENVLARALNLPENPTPRTIEEHLITNNDNEVFTLGNNSVRPLIQNQIVNHSSRNQPAPMITNQAKSTSSENVTRVVNNFVDDEEERRIQQELEIFAEAEMDLHSPVKQPKQFTRTNNKKTPDIFEEDMDFNSLDFNNIDQIERNSLKTPIKAHSSKNNNIDLSHSLELEDDDIFANIDIDEHLNNAEKAVENEIKLAPSPSKALLPNKMNLTKLLLQKNNITRGVFKLKAKFKRVVEKLSCTEDEYKLCIAIEDESGEITVKVHSDVISNLTRYAPDVLMSFRQDAIQEGKKVADKVIKAIQRLKDGLTSLDNLMEIEVRKIEEFPVIVKIL